MDTQQRSQTANGRATDQLSQPTRDKSEVKRRAPWTLINFWLDSALLVIFLSLVFVSVIVRFMFPVASSAQGWTLWGWNLEAWMGAQFALIGTLAFGIVVHLMLHWSWVCGVLFGRILPRTSGSKLPDDGIRTIYGVGLMIAILNAMGLLIAIAALCIRSSG